MAKNAIPKITRRLVRMGKIHSEGEGELKSHQSVVNAARKLIRRANISDVTIVFELGFFGTQRRIDLAIVGKNQTEQTVILILEIKNFDNTISLPTSEEDINNFKILTDTYGLIDHPSLKAQDYKRLLLSALPTLNNNARFKVLSYGYAPRYTHNGKDVLYNDSYKPVLKTNFCFCHDNEKQLIEIIRREFSGGQGWDAFHELLAMSAENDNDSG